jgi:hypothetical protein
MEPFFALLHLLSFLLFFGLWDSTRNKHIRASRNILRLEERMDELGKSHSALRQLVFDLQPDVRELKDQMSNLFTIGSDLMELKKQMKEHELGLIDCNGIAIAAKMEAEQARKDFVKLPLRIAEMLKKPRKKRPHVRRKK